MARSRTAFSMQRGMTRVVFGSGRANGIGQDVEALGARRVLVICTPGRNSDALAMASRLGSSSAGVLAIAREHVPIACVNEARAEATKIGADGLLAFGGGSAIGLAKAVAAGRSADESALRIIAVPTTYSGSEMTPIYGITEDAQKRTARDERARAALVVYDPDLTSGLSREVSVTSLWNAMAHAVEVLWVKDVDRATRLVAEQALQLLASSVSRLAARLDDADARDDALEGAYLAGSVFGDAGGGLHHKLCHLLGGMFGLPHAATHAQLLPHVVRYQEARAPHAMAAIARALGVVDAPSAVLALARRTGVQPGLEALGMPREGIARAIDAVIGTSTSTSTSERDALEELFTAAFAAAPAQSSAPAVRAPAQLGTRGGFGSRHESELLAGALPRGQNTPRPPPYGLYPELLSGTPFTVRNAENTKMWMYRIRPSFSHGLLRPLASPRFACALGDADPNRVRWRPLPIPPAESGRVDLVDGLVTLGGCGEPTSGPGYAVHLYAANAGMADRSFCNADGDLLFVPQEGTLEVRTELGYLRAAPGSILHLPRGLKLSVGLPERRARGWVLEVFGTHLRLPERGPIGSNGLADARHFLAPEASYEDRLCPQGFETVHKLGGRLYTATQEHSPFDVVAWQGTHVPTTYDLMLFNAMGSATFDHADPSIHTVLTAPLDDRGRAVADFVVFRGRWDVAEHSFRPPFMHRNAASEINGVVRTPSPGGGYEPGCTFVTPLLTAHGISTKSYDDVLGLPDSAAEGPQRLPDESLWIMFESALPFRATSWARDTPLVDPDFLAMFEGMRSRFAPPR